VTQQQHFGHVPVVQAAGVPPLPELGLEDLEQPARQGMDLGLFQRRKHVTQVGHRLRIEPLDSLVWIGDRRIV
jgi:hypothetical protein